MGEEETTAPICVPCEDCKELRLIGRKEPSRPAVPSGPGVLQQQSCGGIHAQGPGEAAACAVQAAGLRHLYPIRRTPDSWAAIPQGIGCCPGGASGRGAVSAGNREEEREGDR